MNSIPLHMIPTSKEILKLKKELHPKRETIILKIPIKKRRVDKEFQKEINTLLFLMELKNVIRKRKRQNGINMKVENRIKKNMSKPRVKRRRVAVGTKPSSTALGDKK